MAQALYRLIYYSRNLIPGTPEEISDAIANILAVSQRNNTEAGVTGALMFNAGCFAQVLEGPRRAVEATFERIQRDERHSDVMVLEFGQAASRSFPSWSMAFVGRSLSGETLFSQIRKTSGFDEKRLEGERIYGLLRELVLDEERSAA